MTDNELRLDEKMDRVLELANETNTAVQKIAVKLDNTEEKLNDHIACNKEEHSDLNIRIVALEQRRGQWYDKTLTFVLGAAIAYIVTELIKNL